MDHRLKQIIYRANHRGIKEMDILLGGFAKAKLDQLNDSEVDEFETLMEHSDRDLLTWFTGEVDIPSDVKGRLFDAILEFQQKSVLKDS